MYCCYPFEAFLIAVVEVEAGVEVEEVEEVEVLAQLLLKLEGWYRLLLH